MGYFYPQTPGYWPPTYYPTGVPSYPTGPPIGPSIGPSIAPATGTWSGASPTFSPNPGNPKVLLERIRPLVKYGLHEAQRTGVPHAMTEVALIAYLMGRGYTPKQAHQLVESWEIDESFPG